MLCSPKPAPAEVTQEREQQSHKISGICDLVFVKLIHQPGLIALAALLGEVGGRDAVQAEQGRTRSAGCRLDVPALNETGEIPFI